MARTTALWGKAATPKGVCSPGGHCYPSPEPHSAHGPQPHRAQGQPPQPPTIHRAGAGRHWQAQTGPGRLFQFSTFKDIYKRQRKRNLKYSVTSRNLQCKLTQNLASKAGHKSRLQPPPLAGAYPASVRLGRTPLRGEEVMAGAGFSKKILKRIQPKW